MTESDYDAKYARKTLTPDLSSYRKKDDFFIAKINKMFLTQLPIERKKWTGGDRETTDHVPFHEGAHLIGLKFIILTISNLISSSKQKRLMNQ